MTGGTIRRSVIPVFPGFRRDKLGVSHPINRYRLVSFLFSAGCRQIYFLLNGSGFVWSKFTMCLFFQYTPVWVLCRLMPDRQNGKNECLVLAPKTDLPKGYRSGNTCRLSSRVFHPLRFDGTGSPNQVFIAEWIGMSYRQTAFRWNFSSGRRFHFRFVDCLRIARLTVFCFF